jgi:hypothetical protein
VGGKAGFEVSLGTILGTVSGASNLIFFTFVMINLNLNIFNMNFYLRVLSMTDAQV